ncbi:MAG TPA: PilT/PilU family type 4a pilus ATPase [Aridibacter sp.]|nr:PilT/PilU family type 4a pilus ATPase [Aridibacter sp.]
MENLNEYLQKLVSNSGSALHLEPNKNPYVVTDGGNSDLSASPLQGSQINSMIFTLIPNEVKQQLPGSNEVEFVHPHNLGDFTFHVRKSPSGFNVTITPASAPTAGDDDDSWTEPAAPAQDAAPDPLEGLEFNSVAPSPSSANDIHGISYDSEPEFFREIDPDEIVIETNYADEDEPAALSSPVYEPEVVQVSESTEESAPAAPTVAQNAPEVQTSPPVVEHSPYSPEPPAPSPQIAPPQQQPQVQQVPVQPQFVPVPVPVEAEDENLSLLIASVSEQARSQMEELFRKMEAANSSDLHMSVSVPPMIRKDGKMMPLEAGNPALTTDSIRALLTSIMPQKNLEEFARRNDSDFAYEIPGLARFRANIFMDRKGMGGVFRIIPTDMLTAEDLGLSKHILDLCNLSKGLVVVTGPTGSGKSTTLCAMINYINERREDHIITIEDPIEFTHENKKCLVNQREVHNHTDSFKDALRAALREDPDILLVGEMRDLETISIAIETAETGHLVFGTLHTTTAASTVDRIIDQFPADRQQQIRVMLSESLRGVIAQTLLPKKGGGRVAALEVLIVTPAISNLIREGKTFQIPSSMQTGKNLGMSMLNDSLIELVRQGLVEPRDAYIKAVDKTGFELLLQRSGMSM